MSKPDRLRRTTETLRKLGAPEPEAWAESEVHEGIPQTGRFLFLRQAWRHIVQRGDAAWIDRMIAAGRSNPGAPYAGAGLALARLRDRGASAEELTELVRAMQAELLFSFCYLLEDPGDVEPEVKHIQWALLLVDEDGTPTEPLDGLHESVLETDPLQQEVRPPPSWR